VRPDGRPDAADPAGQGVVQDGCGCLGGQALALAGAADLVADLWFGAACAADEQAAVAQHPAVGPVADGVPQQPVLPLRLSPPTDPGCGLGQGRKRPPADGVGFRIAEDLVELGSVLGPERPQLQPAGHDQWRHNGPRMTLKPAPATTLPRLAVEHGCGLADTIMRGYALSAYWPWAVPG
jgi:hypothetical protein